MDTKLLIYIEPLIEAGWPNMRLWWLKFAEKSLASILGKDFDWDTQCRIITSDYFKQVALSDFCPDENLDLSVWRTYPNQYITGITLKECWGMFNTDCTEAAKRWTDGPFSEDDLEATALFFKDKLDEFKPNVVLTFSAVPFLEYAYPDAVILHQEAGILSQAPYPYTLLFDPVGVRGNSAVRKFSKELNALEVTDEVRRGLDLFRATYIENCILPKSPFSQLKRDLEERYESIWIFPYQWHFVAGWDRSLPMQHMWDMMTWVLEKAGPKTGIILTEHPGNELYFTKERIHYWKSMFPNFIYIEEEWRVSSATQFLMELADGVICQHSHVAYQPMLWRKKLVVLGETQFNDIADGTALDNLNEIANEPWNSQIDAQLYWLLTHYNILPEYLTKGSFCADFIQRCLAAKEQHGEMAFSVFQPYKNAESVLLDIVDKCNPDIPVSRLDNPANLNLEVYIELVKAKGISV